MSKLDLNPNESIILQSKNVASGKILAVHTDELILTNQNVIHISKGVLGNTKSIRKFPVNQIKTYNGEPQVILGKDRNSLPRLELYFLSGQENFCFQSLRKKEAKQWVNAIYKLMTGNETVKASWESAIPGSEFLAKKIKGTMDAFKDTLADNSNRVVSSKKVTQKCGSCSAPLTGFKGQVIQCKYCDTAQAL